MSSDHLDAILNAMADPVFVKDRQHRWTLLNDAMCRFMGRSRDQLLGKSDFDFFPAAEAQVFWAHDEIVFETGETDVNEEEFTDAHGVTHHIVTKKCLCRTAGGELFIVGIIRDITRERLLESHMMQMQKMEALGQMARGIAHDFNNQLSIITGYSQLVLNELPASNPLRRDLEEVLAAGRSAAALTRQILTFSRNTVLQPRDICLNDVVRNLAPMLRSLLGDRVELELGLREGLDAIHADPQQLTQVLVNLALNARDAMPDGGRLRVTTASARADFLPSEGGDPARFVLLQVTDTGVGMDAGTQARVFEPFFTTKKRGQGAGLGLSLVYGIVTASGGSVQVQSQPGEGTTFRILLPLASARPVAEPGSTTGATVLVVEDEKALRTLVSRVLQAGGHHVLTAEDRETALDLARTHPGALDLVIADLTLPGASGRAVAEEIRRFRPDVRLLFMSGYSDEENLPGPFLAKPFTPTELEQRVQALLGPEGGSA